MALRKRALARSVSWGAVGLAIAAACARADNHGRLAACKGGADDSALAAFVALDTLNRSDPFNSVILRYSRDSTGFRIVTMPAPGRHILDGMAIIRLTPECRIISVVKTDSA